jgi:prepilin signal peptidase PulO-like enzyme (type II secretory pathway)
MQQETFIIGSREFTCVRMNAFAANKLLMRLQKIAVPVMGSLMGAGKGLGDIDVKEAAAAIAEHLDESLMDTIVLPMFAEAKVFSAEQKKFVKAGTDIDQCFTTENLFDLYQLIFEVARYQFGPFFASLAERFGSLTDGGKKA